MQVEICANSIQSAQNAVKGGASRVELCQNLNEGGTTPSLASIEYCVKKLHLRTHVLVRPRPGDFCYNDLEFETICRDVEYCKQVGAHAVVVGFLHEDGSVDVEKTRRVVELASPMDVTFHRAFDCCKNPFEALEQIISCGCHHLLTSGCEPTAEEGIDTLHKLVEQASGRISIIAASGIKSTNVCRIIAETGVREVHGSCKHLLGDVVETDVDEVKNLIKNINDYEG